MLKYGMPDLRAFFDADLRWLRHYGFSALNVPTLQRGLSEGDLDEVYADWLHDHLETDANLDMICDTLNRIGLEVEEVINPSAKLAGFEVAEIVSTEQHPDADRLKKSVRLRVVGENKSWSVVRQMPVPALKVFFNEGAVFLPVAWFWGKAKIRGVESRGMMCSLAELERLTITIIELQKLLSLVRRRRKRWGITDFQLIQ